MVGYNDQGKPIGAINAETLLAANAFFRAGLIEPWGRGIERITQACEEEGYPRPLRQIEPRSMGNF